MDHTLLQQLEELINKSLFAQEKRLEQRFATKDDLARFATKDDLSRFATKDDLVILREHISEDLGNVMNGLLERLDEKKADKKDFDDLDKRVDKLERKVTVY